jgi:hypothetical protein
MSAPGEDHDTVRSPDVPATSGNTFIQRILAENKQDIKANLAILACRSCSNDTFLLMILLMITTKILARYASAAALCGAQNTSIGSHDSDATQMASTMHQERPISSTSDHADRLVEMSRAWGGNGMLLATPGGGPEEQLSPREAVQRVLRELHQVQRLIAQLSVRRKSLESQETSAGPTAGLFEDPVVQSLENSNSNRVAMTCNPSRDSTAGVATTTPLSVRTLHLVEGDVRKSLSALSAVVRGVLRNS